MGDANRDDQSCLNSYDSSSSILKAECKKELSKEIYRIPSQVSLKAELINQLLEKCSTTTAKAHQPARTVSKSPHVIFQKLEASWLR